MIFHEQHSSGYGFPSLLLATRASADVSELVFKHEWRKFKGDKMDPAAEERNLIRVALDEIHMYYVKHDERQEIGYSNQNKKSKSMPSTELSCSDILRRPQKLGPSSTYNLTLLKQCQKKWKMVTSLRWPGSLEDGPNFCGVLRKSEFYHVIDIHTM